jgi:molybdenum cofactor cytidylyltransferase
MLARVVDALLGSRARPVVVVTGHQSEALRALLADRELRFVHNPEYGEGIGSSIRVGVGALEDVEGALVCLGDMPWVRPGHVDALIDTFAEGDRRSICVPTHAGRRGHPVLFAARFFPELARLGGDRGARRLLVDHADDVRDVDVDDPGVLLDVDTAEQLDGLGSGRG